MASTLGRAAALNKRDVFYQRQRTKNRVFAAIASFFAAEAERENITKREIASRLSCDPSQITRWLSAPSNMTIDGVSDILLSLGAEADLNIVKFEDRPLQNYVHPLIEATIPAQLSNTPIIPPPPAVAPAPIYIIAGAGYSNGTTSAMIAGNTFNTIVGTTLLGGIAGSILEPSTYNSLSGQVLTGHQLSYNSGATTWSSPQDNQPHHQFLDFETRNIVTFMPTPTKSD
jgi:hypothetical protein